MNIIRKTTITRLVAAGLTMLILVAGSGCGASDSSTSSDSITDQTLVPGTLTIATGEPAYPPYVIDNKPESGKGYEAAVAYAVAEKMGFKKDQVKWTRTAYDAAIAPGPKDFDMNIQQFGITPERKQAVDFTPSYYNSTQSILVKADSKYASAKSLADIKSASVGAAVGTTAYTLAKEKIKSDIQTFNDNTSLAQALDAGQIDAIIFDTPAAVSAVHANQIKNGKVLGQIEGSEDPEGSGIVLPKGSKLTKAASKAVTDLQNDGTLKKLQDTWFKEYTDISVLK